MIGIDLFDPGGISRDYWNSWSHRWSLRSGLSRSSSSHCWWHSVAARSGVISGRDSGWPDSYCPAG